MAQSIVLTLIYLKLQVKSCTFVEGGNANATKILIQTDKLPEAVPRAARQLAAVAVG